MKRRERQRETSAAEKGNVELRRDDLLWKDLLARFFVPMLYSLLPDLACDIDEKRDVVFLDKELRRLARFTRHEGYPARPDGDGEESASDGAELCEDRRGHRFDNGRCRVPEERAGGIGGTFFRRRI